MKFKGDKKQFLQALKEVSKAVDSKSSIDILKNVLVTALEGSGIVELTGYNYTICIQTGFPATIVESGKITVRADMLLSTLDLSRGDSFVFGLKDGDTRAKLKTDSGNYQIHVVDCDMYPDVSRSKQVKSKFSVSSSDLARVFKQAVASCDTKDTREFMHGVHVSAKDNEIYFTGASWKGTTIAFIKFPEPVDEFQFIVMKDTISNLLSSLPSAADLPVFVALYDNAVAFDFSGTSITSRLLNLNYPDVRKRIVSEEVACCGFDVGVNDLMSAAKSIVNISGKDKSIGTKIKLTLTEEDSLIVSTQIDVASGEERVNVFNKTKPCACEAVLDGSVLMSFLSVFDSSTVRFRYIADDIRQLKITSTDEKENVLCVVMAMQN